MRLERKIFFVFALIFCVQSLSFAQQDEKLSLKIGFEGSYTKRNDNSNIVSTALNQEKDTLFFENVNTNGETKEYSGGLSLDLIYKIDKKNVFSFSFSHLQLSNQNNLFTNQTRIDSSFANRTPSAYRAEDFYEFKSRVSKFGACYSYNFNDKGKILSIGLDGSFSNSESRGNNLRIYDNPSAIYWNFNGLDVAETQDNNIALNVFYNYAYDESSKISLGLRLNHDWSDKNADYNYYDSLNNIYNIKDIAFSYIYRNRNNALNCFFDWKQIFNRLTMNVRLDWNLKNEEFSYQSHYWPDDTSYMKSTIEPSVYLFYKANKNNDFNFAYTLRTTTPSATNLTIHKLYGGDNFTIGNRNLKSSQTHSLIAGWQTLFSSSQTLSLSAYYKHSFNEIDYATDFTLDDYYGYMIAYSMPYNMKTSFRYGLDANANLKIGNLLNLSLFANIYRYYYEIDYPKTGLYSSSTTSYSFNLKLWRQFFKNTELYASFNYSSLVSRLFYVQKENYSIDLGVKTEVLDKKLSLFVDFIDVFNLSKQGYEITNPYFSSFNLNEYKGIYVRFGVSYKFGKI
ncbi:MAG: TonB-dependent receptor [Bacteroidales bacterium]|nr:TonB-dependent receptor [Bacteroidales bacterium]